MRKRDDGGTRDKQNESAEGSRGEPASLQFTVAAAFVTMIANFHS